jgi:hypothetical protein
MSDIFSAADWSQAPMLVPASKQFPLLIVGEFGLGGIPTAVGQFSPYRSPGQSERTRGGNGGSKGERGADRQHLTPAKRCAPDEEGREQNAAYGAPPRNARKRQLIEPATALGQHEEPGECDPGNEAECTKEEREREVGIDAEHPTRHGAHSEPCCCPREAHPECTANASQPLPHDRLRPRAAHLGSLCAQWIAKCFVMKSTTLVGGIQERSSPA